MNFKQCIFFTDGYPYDIYFEQFIENEASYLSKGFDKVYVFPANIKDTQREYPSNFEIVDLNKLSNFSKINILKAIPFALITILVELYYAKHKIIYFKCFLKKLKLSINAKITSKTLNLWFNKNNFDTKNTIAYSYWTMHWMHVLHYTKKQFPNLKVISRAHTEMYEEIFDYLYADFNYTKYNASNEIYCISENAASCIKRDYPIIKDRIKVAYLGTFDKGFKENLQNNIFTILTCSTIHPRKQIHIIVEILSHIDFEIKWIHFGSGEGEYLDNLNKSISLLNKNVTVELKGYTKNQLILDYYLNHKIDLFLNISTAEGLPVSLMEAASFGIPLLGTNIFGTPEVVGYTKGMLIDLEFNPKDVALLIKKYYLSDSKIDRKEIRELWNKRFNAEKNYTSFINQINN